GGWGGEPPVQYHISDDEEDKAFYARADRPRSPTSPIRREYALHHYNADPGNEVKYELVEATHSNCIFVGYAHVNFVARPRGGSKERLDTMVPTCLRSLDSEDDRVGGLAGEPWEDHAGPDEALYCFACHDALKHPKDGTCYKAGH
uniref:Uncharacterized protein n=1 Tax=Setaria italica TaxID=4555 RepID=K3YZE9_SETIT